MCFQHIVKLQMDPLTTHEAVQCNHMQSSIDTYIDQYLLYNSQEFQYLCYGRANKNKHTTHAHTYTNILNTCLNDTYTDVQLPMTE